MTSSLALISRRLNLTVFEDLSLSLSYGVSSDSVNKVHDAEFLFRQIKPSGLTEFTAEGSPKELKP